MEALLLIRSANSLCLVYLASDGVVILNADLLLMPAKTRYVVVNFRRVFDVASIFFFKFTFSLVIIVFLSACKYFRTNFREIT